MSCVDDKVAICKRNSIAYSALLCCATWPRVHEGIGLTIGSI
jgi:hypothetical protein